MRTLLIITFVALIGGSVEAAVCKGEDPCKACRDCSACRYCSPKNPKGGSCGKLRDQTAREREEAARKRAKRAR